MFGLPDLAFGIIALLLVGASWCMVGVIFGDAPKRGLQTALVQFCGATCSLLIGLFIANFILDEPTTCSRQEMIYTCGTIFVASIFNYFGLQAMGAGMKCGPNGAVWGIMQSALIFPYLGGLILFAQPMTLPNILGMLLVMSALVFFAMAKNQKQQPGVEIRNEWRFYAFLALGIIAIQQNLATAPSAYFDSPKLVSPVVRSLSAASGTLFAACIWTLVREIRQRGSAKEMFRGLKNPWLYLYVLGMQPFNLFFAYVLLYPGLDAMGRAGVGSVCYPLMVGSCIVSFSLYSIFGLKEKVTKVQIAALVLCVIGLAGLCFPKDWFVIPWQGWDIAPWIRSLGGY